MAATTASKALSLLLKASSAFRQASPIAAYSEQSATVTAWTCLSQDREQGLALLVEHEDLNRGVRDVVTHSSYIAVLLCTSGVLHRYAPQQSTEVPEGSCCGMNPH